ncbi:MAG: Fimbrial assembly family protein [Frankiales bacterium]|nr:Fimbrial assembly family protein [Frankiales bacterium]
MTVVSSEVRLGMTNSQLPRVNLLPPEIAETAMLRKVQVSLGVGLVATVGVVGLLFVSASHSVSSANSDLDRASSQSTSLIKQKASYANVTATYDAAAAAQAQLTTAMGQEVRYSQLLHDLSLSVPSTVWLKSLTYTQVAPAAPAPGAAGTAAAASIGTLAVTGVGFDHDDLALWLESLGGQKNYSDPYFSASNETLMGTRKTVNFTSTANLTPAALSGRYTKPLGD